MTKTRAEQDDLLKGLGLPTTGDSLSPVVETEDDDEFKIAPKGVNPREMPVKDIVFDPKLLDKFNLTSDRKYAAEFVHEFYKGPRGQDRNKVLWAAVGRFIEQVKTSRATGGIVKDKVKATTKERQLGQLLAALDPEEMVLIEEAIVKIQKKRDG